MTTSLASPDRIADLQTALQSPDPAIRFNAGLDLVKAGDVTGIPALIEAFEHESASVRLFHASKALVHLGKPAVPALEQALHAAHPQVRIDAACTLYQIEPDRFSTLLPFLNEALQAADAKVMGDALQFLSLVTDQDRRLTVPALLQALRNATPAADPEGWVTDPRISVAVLLAQIGEPVAAIVAALVAALQGALPAVRWAAACALAELGSAAHPALPALAQTVRDEAEVETVRVEAAYALAVIGEPVQETLPVLVAAAQSADWWVRAFAARLLGELGATTARPVPELFDAMTRALMGMRRLPQIDKPPAALVQTLVHLLADPDYNVRRNAIAALAQLAEPAAPAISALVDLLPQADVGPLAAETLAKIGAAAHPALQGVLRQGAPPARRHAAYGLSLLYGPKKETASIDGEISAPQRFTPATEHFYCQVQVDLNQDKVDAFEGLYQATVARGQGVAVDYTLPYPKHEFLRYLVEHKGLFLHGSGKADIDVLKPFRYGIDAADHGNVSGIYADKDPIRPIYFAVVNGARCFGQSNGYFNLLADGQHSSKGDLPCNERFYKLAIGVNGLRRPFWRPGMIYILPPETFTFHEEWTSRAPVPLLMRLAVTPDDLPLREQVWGSDWRQLDPNWVDPHQPFPFLKDVQNHPILPSGLPLWCQ